MKQAFNISEAVIEKLSDVEQMTGLCRNQIVENALTEYFKKYVDTHGNINLG